MEIDCNKEEIWKDVEGYEGLYQISSLGRVKSLFEFKYGIREKILNLQGNADPRYKVAQLHKDGKLKRFSVHRLVAQAFIQNDDPVNKIQVNHKDLNPSNNRVENLEWCTPFYNMHYGSEDRIDYNKHNCKKISCYTLEGVFVKEYPSVTDASFEASVTIGTIAKAVRGERKTAGGYQWRPSDGTTDNIDPVASHKIRSVNKYENIRVLQLTKDGECVREYSSISEASRLSGITLSSISRAIGGTRKTAGGWVWKKDS